MRIFQSRVPKQSNLLSISLLFVSLWNQIKSNQVFPAGSRNRKSYFFVINYVTLQIVWPPIVHISFIFISFLCHSFVSYNQKSIFEIETSVLIVLIGISKVIQKKSIFCRFLFLVQRIFEKAATFQTKFSWTMQIQFLAGFTCGS